jgi:hypothetical protein
VLIILRLHFSDASYLWLRKAKQTIFEPKNIKFWLEFTTKGDISITVETSLKAGDILTGIF